MKTKLIIAASTVLMLSATLVAANVNGFENFVLSRNDFKSTQSSPTSRPGRA